MKKALLFIANTLARGLVIVIPIYLTVLLLLKAMASVRRVVHPLARLVPDWVPAERALSLLLVLLFCFLIGVTIRTRTGRAAEDLLERTVLGRIPGYSVIRGLTHQVAGDDREGAWKPALAEIEEALVPAFIIEEFEDGRYTVFVPSIPTPLAGAVYILERGRVHPLKVSFPQYLRVISAWGLGAKDLVMRGSNLQPGQIGSPAAQPPGG
jgi:uncharacterized membrane protein